MSAAPAEPPAVDGLPAADAAPGGLVPLRADEYDVVPQPGRHRGPGGPDPVRAAQSVTQGVTEGIAGKVGLGLGLIKATAGLGFRLLGLARAPLALNVGPLGRTQQQATLERPPVAVRSLGEDLDLSPEVVEQAFPHATEWLVVFVPARGADESAWRRGSGSGYPAQLAGLLGWTPVHVRADDTVPFGTSGVELSALLQDLVDAWPVPPTRIALVGHGTGGLVARGACGVRSDDEQPWTDLVTDVVALGTPWLVAPVQRGSRDPGRRLEERLAGIIAGEDTLVDVPPLEGARYALVTDETTTSPNPVGRVLGDLLWWRQRATLRSRKARDLFPTAERYEVSTAQSPLTNHPDVQHALLQWLA